MTTFDVFWASFPRKKDKAAAQRAWTKAVKRADADIIVKAAVRYRDDPNRSTEFTKYPATWLNADGWLDEPDTVTAQREMAYLPVRFDDEPEGVTFKDWLDNYATAEERAKLKWLKA